MHLLNRIRSNTDINFVLLGTNGQLNELPNPVPLATSPDLLIDTVISAADSENGNSHFNNRHTYLD